MNHYVACLDRRAVVAALGTLKRIGFAVFMPVQREFMIRRNRRIVVEKHPLQDYAFITGASPWKVRGFAIGVKELLKANGEWVTVHESEIAHLREEKPPPAELSVNDRVRSIIGSEERIGRVMEVKSQQRKARVQFPDCLPAWLSMGQVKKFE